MIEKIKNNKYMIFLVAGIVAVALAIYGFSSSVNNYYDSLNSDYPYDETFKIQLLIDEPCGELVFNAESVLLYWLNKLFAI